MKTTRGSGAVRRRCGGCGSCASPTPRRIRAGQRWLRKLCKAAGSQYPHLINYVSPAQPMKCIDDAGSAGVETMFSTYALRDSKKALTQDVRIWYGKLCVFFCVCSREGLETTSRYPHYPHRRSLAAFDLRFCLLRVAGVSRIQYPQPPEGVVAHHPQYPLPRRPQTGCTDPDERPTR